MIWKWIKILLTMLVVSMFFFPFAFSAFPTQNTKNLMAAVGLVFLLMTFVYKRDLAIPRELLILLLLSVLVSLASLAAIVYNQTPDNSYVTYIRTAIIWLSAAYVPCAIIRMVHGRIDVPLVLNYLVGVCLFQCLMAMLIHFVPAVQHFVDAHIQQGQDLLKDLNRLYGIGAMLDVAGSRFAAVLVAIAVYIERKKEELPSGLLLVYILSFIIITVIGNMIARTTLVGVGLGLGYLLVKFVQSLLSRESFGSGKMVGVWLTGLAITIPLAVVLYALFPAVNELMRFAFEGFFSLAETGEWNVASNNTLESMVVFPEELRTWIIGDGYFENSRNDINYLGDATTGGYYMGTDIGYLRFIFYFGVIGLVAMSLVILYAASMCAKAFLEYRTLFWLVCLVNFVVWFKVSTDIFLFFCLFICASIVQQEFPEDEEDDAEDTSPVPEGVD